MLPQHTRTDFPLRLKQKIPVSFSVSREELKRRFPDINERIIQLLIGRKRGTERSEIIPINRANLARLLCVDERASAALGVLFTDRSLRTSDDRKTHRNKY